MNEQGNQTPPRNETAEVFKGMGLLLLLHLIQIPLGFLSGGISLIAVGVSQLLYVIPGVIIAQRKDRRGIIKGMIIMAGITFLLNAACFGILMSALLNL